MSTSTPPQPQIGAAQYVPPRPSSRTARGELPPVARRRRLPPRVWVRRVHFWATLTLGILLLIVTTSGAAIVFEPEINRQLHAELFHANPGQASVDLDGAIVAVKQGYPNHHFHYVTPPRRGDRYLIEIDRDDHPLLMLVDPVDGSLHGPFDRTAGLMGWMVRLHTTLFADETLLPGVGWPLSQVLLGIAAIALLVMVCTGAVLWWPGVKRIIRNGFAVRLGRNAYTTHHDFHKVVGFIALAPLLIWGLTGANFEFYEQMRAAWYWVMPGDIPADPPTPAAGDAAPAIPASEAVKRALAAAPGARLASVVPPGEEANYFGVWLSRGVDSYEYFDWPGDCEVRVDPATGAILGFAYTNYDNLASEIYEGWLFSTHAGTFAPWHFRVFWLLFGLAPLALAITGLRMWWLKRRGPRRWSSRRATSRDAMTSGLGTESSSEEGINVIDRLTRGDSPPSLRHNSDQRSQNSVTERATRRPTPAQTTPFIGVRASRHKEYSRMRPGPYVLSRCVALLSLFALLLPAASVGAQTPTPSDAGLQGVKTYLVEHVALSKGGTAQLVSLAQRYYDLAAASDFDYEALWEQHGPEITALLDDARQTWVNDASANYELSEGLVAGVPSLAYFDVWIDAGSSGEDDPANALDVQVTLPDGRVLDRPGSLYHYVSEPALWGTIPDAVGLEVDMDADGTVELGEVLPEANRLLGAAQALDAATGELQTAVDAWEPTPDDAFTALVIMIPTMSGYFEEWKGSVFVSGEETTESRFVGVSRLADVNGILHGLEVTFDNMQPAVAAADEALATQIDAEMRELVAFVQDLYDQESAGTQFTPEQADQFGSELQNRATATAGLVAQAAALLGVTIQEG